MDERIWADKPISLGETITLGKVSIVRKKTEPALLISGDLEKARTTLALAAKIAGLGGEVGTGDFMIRMGRDSAILFAKTPIDTHAGWHKDGFAISHAHEKYATLEISGEGAETLLAQGASVDFKQSSPSAAIRFCGLVCLLVKQDGKWLLFVETPMLTYISTFLKNTTQIA